MVRARPNSINNARADELEEIEYRKAHNHIATRRVTIEVDLDVGFVTEP